MISVYIKTEPGQRHVPHLFRTVGANIDNPHIHPKKLSANDKWNARRLKIEY
jgi:hypothetical protein